MLLSLAVYWMLAAKTEEPLTVNQALMIAVATLAGVVVVLFAYLRSVDARQEKKLAECEEDRRQLWISILELGGNHPQRQKRV